MMDQKKLHFMHIPKTAGTSLAAVLDQQFKFEAICPSYFVYHLPPWADESLRFSSLSPEKIREYSFFMHHLGWIPRLFFAADEIDTITFLRDPIERMLSEFSHMSRDASAYPRLSKRWKSFDDFLWDPVCDDFFKANIQTRSFCADLYHKKDFSCDTRNDLASEFVQLPFGYPVEVSDEKLLQLATERLHSCAFVGLTEKYDESLALLGKRFPQIIVRKAAKLNVAPSRVERSQLSAKALDRAMELNQLDLKLYQEAVQLLQDMTRTVVSFSQPRGEQAVSESATLPSEIKFSFNDSFVGLNWHVREKVASQVFSWSGDNTSTLVFPVKPQGDFVVSFHALRFLVPEAAEELTLSVNAYPVRLVYFPHPDEGLIFEGSVPREALKANALLELSFALPEVKKPIELNPEVTDTRKLGFACQSVHIMPFDRDFFASRTALFRELFKKMLGDAHVLKQALQQEQNIRQELELKLNATLNSTSWRLTKPLRYLKQKYLNVMKLKQCQES